MKKKTIRLFGVLLLLSVPAVAGPLLNGNFDANPNSPGLLTPWQVLGSTVGLSVTRVTAPSPVVSGPFSLRVSGRGTATDGAAYQQSLLTNLTNGATYVTRCQIWLDHPAQVRCLLFISSSIPQTPILLAERVIRAGETGGWVGLQGSQKVAWTGSASAARLYFAVEQIFPNGGAEPAHVWPAYNLDDVTMELDDDGDGKSNTEEGTAGTNPALKDSDGDTMPDAWELAAQLNPNDPADAALDADGDGHSNKIEYWANTNPHDAASYPGLTSDPLASPATRALLYMLQTRGARGTGKYLSGQHAQDVPGGDYTNYVAGLNTLMVQAGHPSWVSVLGIAAEGPSSEMPLQITTSAPAGRAYMDAGGLVVLHWTPRNPWTNAFNGDHTGVNIADVLTPGTVANVRLTGWMDTVAGELAAFGPNRPVIFRPLSEMNGGWNWYGKLEQDEFVALYRWMRDYFLNTKGLHNIIWTLEGHVGVHRPVSSGSTSSSAGVSMDYYYPGDDAIDLIGFSAYTHNWEPGFDADAQSRLHPKAFAITEGGPPANEDDTANTYNSMYLSALDTYYPRAAFFIIWNSFPSATHLAIKDNANYVELLTDARVTNRETLHYLAPSNLAASAASTAQLSLTWTGTSGATGYQVESSNAGAAPWTTVASGIPVMNFTLGSFAPATTRTVRVRALYPDGDSAPLSVATGTTFTPLQGWSFNYLGDANASLTGDTDHDGLSDLLEAALGLNPLVATSHSMPAQGFISVGAQSYLAITFTRDTALTELTTTVQISSDLLVWNDGSSYGPGGIVTANVFTTEVSRVASGGLETITVRSNSPVGATPQFIRVKVLGP